MTFRLLVLVAALAGGVLTGSVQAQEPAGWPLPNGTELALPLFTEYSAGWSVYLRAGHVRERQPMPLGVLKACFSPKGTPMQFWEKALLWANSLPPRCRTLPPDVVADASSKSSWSAQDWQKLILIWMLQPSLSSLLQAPSLAECLCDTKPVVANSGLESAAGLEDLDHGMKCELCWRCFAAASCGGTRKEVELTYQKSLVETEEYRLSHVAGLVWSGNRLSWRTLQAREFYLGNGLAFRLDTGFTSDLGGNHTEVETMFSLDWYVTEATVLHIGYDLFRQRLLHSGTMVW